MVKSPLSPAASIKKKLPPAIKPMLARLKRSAFDSPEHLFELKWDGIRVLAFIEGGELRIQSRNLRNITSQFPELSVLPKQVKSDLTVIDGELVCFKMPAYGDDRNDSR